MSKLVADILNSLGTNSLLQAIFLPIILLAADYCAQSALVDVPPLIDSLCGLAICGLGVFTTAFIATLVQTNSNAVLKPAGAFMGLLIAGIFWGISLVINRFERRKTLPATQALPLCATTAFISSFTSFLCAVLLLKGGNA